MKVLVTGGSGFVGQGLVQALLNKSYEVNVTTRNIERVSGLFDSKVKLFKWNYLQEKIPLKALDEVVAIIHLMGEPVGDKRWTSDVKSKIRDSRIISTRNLIKSLNLNPQVKTIVGASAIGIYGDRGDEVLTECSRVGSGFLAEVCTSWEQEFFLSKLTVRTTTLRTGIVLGDGGALRKMLPVFKLGFGGSLGSGKQWMSWVHLDDLISIYLAALENKNMSGIFNAVSPSPVTNIEFTKILAKILNKPAIIKTPTIALKLMFGEMASILTSSQKVSSQKLQDFGFKFKHELLKSAFQQLNPVARI